MSPSSDQIDLRIISSRQYLYLITLNAVGLSSGEQFDTIWKRDNNEPHGHEVQTHAAEDVVIDSVGELHALRHRHELGVAVGTEVGKTDIEAEGQKRASVGRESRPGFMDKKVKDN
jgi:hypothetical protein